MHEKANNSKINRKTTKIEKRKLSTVIQALFFRCTEMQQISKMLSQPWFFIFLHLMWTVLQGLI